MSVIIIILLQFSIWEQWIQTNVIYLKHHFDQHCRFHWVNLKLTTVINIRRFIQNPEIWNVLISNYRYVESDTYGSSNIYLSINEVNNFGLGKALLSGWIRPLMKTSKRSAAFVKVYPYTLNMNRLYPLAIWTQVSWRWFPFRTAANRLNAHYGAIGWEQSQEFGRWTEHETDFCKVCAATVFIHAGLSDDLAPCVPLKDRRFDILKNIPAESLLELNKLVEKNREQCTNFQRE